MRRCSGLTTLAGGILIAIGFSTAIEASSSERTRLQTKNPTSTIRVTETSILPDGKEATETYDIETSAHSYHPSAAQAVVNEDASAAPETPDQPPGETAFSVSRVTYYQTGGGYERTTVYERNWFPSSRSWSLWRIVEDHLIRCTPDSKCTGVVTDPS